MSGNLDHRHILRRIAITIACLFFGVLILLFVGLRIAFRTGGETLGSTQKTVHSKDGTTIAYEQTGSGPVVILVGAALADRSGTARLSKALSDTFTIINYDRRGRGKSGDTAPYTVEREVEDIDALIGANGGSAFLFGSSSGSVLALRASSELGSKVTKLFMYEPPFIVDDSHRPVPEDLGLRIEKLVSTGKRDEAVKLFFTTGMGIPPVAVLFMRFLMPGWSKMAMVAQTLPYDLAILAGTQSGKPLPVEGWTAYTEPTLVVVGSRSPSFFHSGARALAASLPHARYSSLNGGNHGTVLLSPTPLAVEMKHFFLDAGK